MPDTFVNRTEELGRFATIMGKDSGRLVFVDAPPKSGMSAFLEELPHTECMRTSASIFVRLQDATGSLSKALLGARIDDMSHNMPTLGAVLNKRGYHGEGAKDIAASLGASVLAASIGFVSQQFGTQDLSPLLTAACSEGVLHGLFEFVRQRSSKERYLTEEDPYLAFVTGVLTACKAKRVVLIVDGAQHLRESCYTEIRRYLEVQRSLVVVLGFNAHDNTKRIATAKTRLLAHATAGGPARGQVRGSLSLSSPDLRMYRLMAEAYGSCLSAEQLRESWAASERNIDLMMEALLDPQVEELTYPSACRLVVACLSFFQEGLGRADLDGICAEDVYVTHADLATSLAEMRSQCMLVGSDDCYALGPCASQLSPSPSETLAVANRALGYFMRRLDGLGESRLKDLVAVAHKVYPNGLRPVRKLLARYGEVTIKRGETPLTEEELEAAFPGETPHELYLRVGTYFLRNDFDRAYSVLLGANREWIRGEEGLRLLWGITLNRVRRQDEAIEVLRPLSEQGSTLDVRTLAAAYLLVTYIYSGQNAKALDIYTNRDRFRQSAYYPYLVRNAASALRHSDEVVQELEDLLCTRKMDLFCKATIECNLGRAFLSRKKYDKAENYLRSSERRMATMRFRNCAVVYNDLALLYLFRNDIPRASYYIGEAMAASWGETPYHTMQRLTIAINDAVIRFKIDRRQALSGLGDIEQRVEDYPVGTIREIYWSTRALLETLSGETGAAGSIAKMRETPDVFDSGLTLGRAQVLEERVRGGKHTDEELWRHAYAPAYLTFWYISPLEILAKSIIR